MQHCPECGERTDSGARVCQNCGTEVQTPSTQANRAPTRGTSTAGQPTETGGPVDDGGSRWKTLLVIAVVVSVLSFVSAGIVNDGTEQSTAGENISALFFLTSWIVLPVAVYYDGKHVSRRTGWPSHRWLWILGAAVWFLHLIVCPLYLYVRRRKLDAVPTFEHGFDTIEAQMAEAEQAVQENRYQAAIDTAGRAIDRTKDIEHPADTDADQRVADLQQRIGASLRQWGTDFAHTRLRAGRDAARDNDYEQASDIASETLPRLYDMAEQIERVDAGPALAEQQNTVRQARFEWECDAVRSRLTEAEETAQSGDWERATEIAGDALAQLDELETESRQLPGADTSELAALRRTAHRVQFDSTVADLRATLERAETHAENGRYNDAVELTPDIIAQVQSAEEQAGKHGLDTAPLEKLRRRAVKRRFEWVEADARSRMEEAETAAANENYQTAVDYADEAVDKLETAMGAATADVDTEPIDALADSIAERSADWERETLVSRINEALAADPEAREQATATLEQVLAETETDALSERERSLIRREARNAYVTVQTRGAERVLECGLDELDAGNYDTAGESFETVTEVVSDALDAADDWEVDTTNLADIGDRAERGYADTRVKLVESNIQQGVEQFERDRYERAEEVFTTARNDAREAQNEVTDDDTRTRLEHLQRVAEDNLESTQRASLGISRGEPTVRSPDDATVTGRRDVAVTTGGQTTHEGERRGGGPTEQTPRTPDITVTYDTLEQGEIVGTGGNADVYRATTTVDGESHVLALKKPRFQGTVGTRVVESFVREAKTWDKLDNHSHIVDVVDWGTEPLPWIAMEYMNSGDLNERVDAPLSQRFWIAETVTDAVLHAHRRGAAHLDLKPENILFRETPSGGWDVPKVADWGLAQLLLEHSKSVEGMTPRYAAPEQLDDGTSAGQAADIYQLGAVFYKLFTGEPPFTGPPVEVVQSIAREPVTPPTALDSSLPERVDDVLLKALSKEPADRQEDLLYLRDSLADLSESV